MLGRNKGRKSPVNRRKRTIRQRITDGIGATGSFTAKAIPWILLLAVLVSVPLMLYKGWRYALGSSLFHIQNVQIEGNDHALDDDILLALGYEGPETNIFTIDPINAARQIEAEVPWVLSARVDRSLPSTVTVTVTERQLGGLALIGELMLLDNNGVPFKPLEREQGVEGAVVTGLGDNPEALTASDHDMIVGAMKIMRLYDEVGVDRYDRLAEVDVDPVFGYTLVTETQGVRVSLGEGRITERLERLAQVLAALEQRSMKVSQIRLDGERSLRHVAVTPLASASDDRP